MRPLEGGERHARLVGGRQRLHIVHALLADNACAFESLACTLAFWQHILFWRYIKGGLVARAADIGHQPTP